MLFLKSILLLIPVIMILFIVVYLHIIVINALFKLILSSKECFSNSTKKASCLVQIKESVTEDFFLTKAKYRGKSLLGIGFGVFFFLHFALFINYYQSYINDETEYHDAKVYYVVGMVPHSYSVILGQQNTPLFPPLLGLNIPATKIKEYLFNQGVKLIPKEDGERELWEYEWFYYPYIIRSSFIYDTYYKRDILPRLSVSKKTYQFFQQKLRDLYKIIEAVNEKKFFDKSREIDSIKEIPLMISYYNINDGWFLPFDDLRRDGITAQDLLYTSPKYTAQKRKMIKYLDKVKDKINNSKPFQAWADKNRITFLKIEAIREQTLLFLMEEEMFAQIRSETFSCKNPIITKYKELRDRYILGSGISMLDRLMDEGREKEALFLNHESKDNIMSEFFRQALEHYCKVEVRGVSKETQEKHNISFHNNLLSEQDSLYHKEVKKLNKIFKGEIDE